MINPLTIAGSNKPFVAKGPSAGRTSDPVQGNILAQKNRAHA
jgi:hypothetical protein